MWLGLRWGAFTHEGWQVILSDPIWQVMLCSSETGFPWRARISFNKQTYWPCTCRCRACVREIAKGRCSDAAVGVSPRG